MCPVLECSMKHLLCLLSLLLPVYSYAQLDFDGCGIYEYKGIVKIREKKMNLFVNEGTKSELMFFLTLKQEAQLAPYLDKQVEGKIQIIKMMDGTRADQFRILDSKRAGIDPLNPLKNSFLKKIENQKCE